MAHDCMHCGEPVLEGEPIQKYGDGQIVHWECGARQIIGSVAHLQKRCSCYVAGSTCGDDPSLTPREAARAAVALFKAQRVGGDLDD